MKSTYRWLSLWTAPVLGGCSTLSSPGGRVVMLVLIPGLVVATVMFLLRQRRPQRPGGRGPCYPDCDERE